MTAGGEPARVFVPGRIEVLGKHTDYAGGRSLLAAVDRGFTFRARPAPGDAIVIRAEETGEAVRWRVRDGRAVPADGERPGWARYANAVLDRLGAGFVGALGGAEIGFVSDLPVAAGLSSSSALVTGVFLALDAALGIRDRPDFRAAVPDREALAAWLSAAEMGSPDVGTRGGSEDHTAILCSQPGRLVRYGLAPVRRRGSAPMPDGWRFAVGVSGVVADKGGAVRDHYNRLSDQAAAAARAWAAGRPGGAPDPVEDDAPLNLGRALSVDPETRILDAVRRGAAALGGVPDTEALVRRARHFLAETVLVDAAFAALEAGDLAGFADAANRSARLGAELLENQVPETLALTALARELGAPAASPFGAGFGGSVWALVREVEAEEFLAGWQDRYRDAFPGRQGARFLATPPSSPAETV